MEVYSLFLPLSTLQVVASRNWHHLSTVARDAEFNALAAFFAAQLAAPIKLRRPLNEHASIDDTTYQCILQGLSAPAVADTDQEGERQLSVRGKMNAPEGQTKRKRDFKLSESRGARR